MVSHLIGFAHSLGDILSSAEDFQHWRSTSISFRVPVLFTKMEVHSVGFPGAASASHYGTVCPALAGQPEATYIVIDALSDCAARQMLCARALSLIIGKFIVAF